MMVVVNQAMVTQMLILRHCAHHQPGTHAGATQMEPSSCFVPPPLGCGCEWIGSLGCQALRRTMTIILHMHLDFHCCNWALTTRKQTKEAMLPSPTACHHTHTATGSSSMPIKSRQPTVTTRAGVAAAVHTTLSATHATQNTYLSTHGTSRKQSSHTPASLLLPPVASLRTALLCAGVLISRQGQDQGVSRQPAVWCVCGCASSPQQPQQTTVNSQHLRQVLQHAQLFNSSCDQQSTVAFPRRQGRKSLRNRDSHQPHWLSLCAGPAGGRLSTMSVNHTLY